MMQRPGQHLKGDHKRDGERCAKQLEESERHQEHGGTAGLVYTVSTRPGQGCAQVVVPEGRRCDRERPRSCLYIFLGGSPTGQTTGRHIWCGALDQQRQVRCALCISLSRAAPYAHRTPRAAPQVVAMSSVALPSQEQIMDTGRKAYNVVKANVMMLDDAGLFKFDHIKEFAIELTKPLSKELFNVPAMQSIMLAQTSDLLVGTPAPSRERANVLHGLGSPASTVGLVPVTPICRCARARSPGSSS